MWILVIGKRFLSSKSSQAMVRVLNVAEKNDAARSISEIMSNGRFRRRDGFSRYNKIYEFEYTVLGQRCNMTMTSVSGHLLNYAFVGSYRKWNACNPLSLFEAPVMKVCLDDYKDIQRTLEAEVRSCSILIIWTDCDREGENIGYEIISVCTKVKPNLKVYRAKFSEITQQSIYQACQTLGAPDKRISDAVDVRQELDLRIGAAFTRFQTLRLQKVFPQVLADSLISYGSCQFPTLGFVVERYKQVQAFISEPFWKIKVCHKIEENEVEFMWKRVRLFDHTACLVLHQICIENPIATVIDTQKKPKSKWRPLPLDTVEMEKFVSRKLNMNAKEAMQIAEKLYTQGYISYPRTETNIFPKEINLAALIELQTPDPNWGEFSMRILQHGPNPRKGSKTDNAHPPIHPIKYTDSLQGKERQLYEFIVRHFLACCSEDAQGEETIIEIDIAGEKFVANGLMIIAKNYLEVYPYEKWNAKTVPVYNVGQNFEPTSIDLTEGETTAPPLLTEADLIALMEKHGIGTDATHADHIETIKQRLYVGFSPEKKFLPGELGMGLVEGYDAMGFEMSKPYLRAELESDLKRICEGLKDPKVVLAEQIRKYREVFVEAINQAKKLDENLAKYFGTAENYVAEEIMQETSLPVMPCPKCGFAMVLKKRKEGTGYYVSCMAYPECKAAIWFPEGVNEVTVKDSFCEECGGNRVRQLEFTFKRGSMLPIYPLKHVGCIGGCDPNFLQDLDINPNFGNSNSSVFRAPSNSDSGYDSGSGRNSFSDTSSVSHNNTSKLFQPPSTVRPLNSNRFQADNNRTSFNNYSNNWQSMTPSSSLNNPIVCNCGEEAILLSVKKDGPNKGRMFYKCSKPNGCNFFHWQDDSSPSTSAVSSNRQNNSFNQFNNGARGNGDVMCQCGLPAKRLTVQKEGPNQGREFDVCSKNRSEQCKFFQWADEPPRTSNNFDQMPAPGQFFKKPRGGTKRSFSERKTTSGPSKQRRCGICGETGHTRKTCPGK